MPTPIRPKTGPQGATGAAGAAGVNAKAVRSGGVVFEITDGTKPVAFGSAMPSANYEVVCQPQISLAVLLWVTDKTTAGFTINAGGAIAATVSWIAVEN